MHYKQKIENFPQTETCELLILDRSIDQIAPYTWWTYDAMCHDLLNMEGNKYVHEESVVQVPAKTSGPPEKKEASERLHEKMTNFVSKNKAAQIQHTSRDGELSTRTCKKMVQALPQYSEQIDKLSSHVELAKLPQDDMNAVHNMRLLGGSLESKKGSTGAFSLKFDIHKELVEKLSKGELSRDEYPCMNDPSATFHGTSHAAPMHQPPAPHSMRSRRTPTWARPRNSDDGYSSDSVLRHASSDFKKMGRRIFVFIVGGATRSEAYGIELLMTKF
ncbi:hypothetical protein GH714_029477 [Hevea brasiliensis]|uniref:Sec1-like protein n=1 Tax=Hevea brasiliensis TaxID=3981 RepID=A0A6A6LES5_HEVBR|nr:hypothetical protein GH714_029477 [Hevea brasiliensis]